MDIPIYKTVAITLHRHAICLVSTSPRMCLPSRLALSQYSKSRLHLLRVWNIFALLVLRFDAFLLMAVEMSRSLGVFVRHDLACFGGCLGRTLTFC